MDIKSSVIQFAQEYLPEIITLRRKLHQFPELSFEEKETSKFIADRLTAWGIPIRTGIAGTGVVGRLEGKHPDRFLLALRADMDALPIQEQNDLPYHSEHPGIMHACGHDMHMASLLGTARILHQLKDHFQGTILFIFQPGEEKLPGGAKIMIEEGLFTGKEPDLIIGQHVLPELDAGKLGFKPGIYMASTDELYFTVKGKGGHGAMPQDVIDPVLIAATIITSLQQIVSRRSNPAIPTVLSIGKVLAQGATNIIPQEVKMEGTFRTLDERWREQAHVQIRQLAESIALSMGGTCECSILKGYPFLINHEEYTQTVQGIATDLLGEKNVVPLDLRMTSEDFAYFSQKYPSVFYRLGVKNPDNEIITPLHTAGFQADERALLTGMSTMSWMALKITENV